MPIHRQTLLADLKRWVTRFENDLREQCKELPELDARLKGQYDLAKKAGRTAMAYSVWRGDELTQAAVGWVLSCVFVRFLEDNDLLERAWISGLGENRELASLTRGAYFTEHRTHSDDDYLRHVFTEVGRLPGMSDLMDERHNALWNASISGDAAKEFIEFWRRIDPATGSLAHDFADPEWDTRFLGDLYQDLSESARKKYALLQTPDFVEEFILDRTLDPAIDTFGLKEVRMIDPTCGSGHFLIGGFRRLLRHWQKERPDLGERELAVHALKGVYGVDINPFAVAIARFRLLLEAWRFCRVKRLRNAPDFHVNLAVGDSLLHGPEPGIRMNKETLLLRIEATFGTYPVEDPNALAEILSQQYHAVVGNPPYITVKDKALNQAYRDIFQSCYRKYALSVPFMERIFDLALSASHNGSESAGFTGQITANSFMKREMGKLLVSDYIPEWNLTHILDTSGAFIPGHGTPTIIILGTNRTPTSKVVRTIMAIKGEEDHSVDPREGKVWNSILGQVDFPGSESEWVSCADVSRSKFHTHPWTLSGGGASDLKLSLDESASSLLEDRVDSIGFGSILGEDEAFCRPVGRLDLCKIPEQFQRVFVEGTRVRDWNIDPVTEVIFPYDENIKLVDHDSVNTPLWPLRSLLESRQDFSHTTYKQHGRPWWEFHQIPEDRNRRPWVLVMVQISTHNEFALSRTPKAFNRSAPLLTFPSTAKSVDALPVLGLLNSSVGCFWMKQVMTGKHRGDGGQAHASAEGQRFDFDGTKLRRFPLPIKLPIVFPKSIDNLAEELSKNSPDALAARDEVSAPALADAESAAADLRARMISLQEELDWQCYRHYGLVDESDDLEWSDDRLDDLPPLGLGERAFEIRMARQMEAGELDTTWFARHRDAGSKPIAELPDHWPDEYRALVERRLAFIKENKNINLIERPEYKRRWNTEPWAKRQQEALRKWLLTRLEAYFFDADRMVTGEDETATARKLAHVLPIRARFAAGGEPRLASTRQLATAAATDSQWMEAAAVYTGRHDFDVPKLVEDLVLAESVPALPANRYKATGLRKRVEWERTWERQRLEDAVELRIKKDELGKSEEELKKQIRAAQLAEVGDIPVPPKYGSGDYAKTSYWKLRGKLDVPKERWILYAGAEGGHDDSPVIAWAGWDHAQQAQALAGFFQQAKTTWGWEEKRLVPLLAALKELLPWLHQWHDEIDPRYRQKLSTIYEQFYQTERQALRMTEGDVEAVRMGSHR